MHRSALGAGALSDEWADTRLPAHVRRDDFVFLVARDAVEIVGFAYGYTGAYGRWWTEHVAAALSAEQRVLWLDPPHFEIVELHVRPASQRRGLGSALLAQLLTRQPHDRAVLTTQAGSRKARAFYAKNGWLELASIDFGAGYPPYVALGKLFGGKPRVSLPMPSLPGSPPVNSLVVSRRAKPGFGSKRLRPGQ